MLDVDWWIDRLGSSQKVLPGTRSVMHSGSSKLQKHIRQFDSLFSFVEGLVMGAEIQDLRAVDFLDIG